LSFNPNGVAQLGDRMPQSLSNVHIHLIFSTKTRQPFLRDEEMRKSLHAYLAGIGKHLDCPAVRIGGVEDHVHILSRMSRTITIADWVKELKRASTIWLKEQGEALGDFQWQAGYAAFSVSQSNVGSVVEYIERQEAHHQRTTFQDELRAFLSKNNIEFDERYLWD